MAARHGEHADALPRARTHPLDGRQQRPPGEHPEFRAHGELLGYRGGVPARRFVTEPVSPGAGNARGPCRVRAHLPGEARHPARPQRVRGSLGPPSGVAVGEPPGDLRAGGPRDGRSRPGLGPDLRSVQAARRLPLRHHRQHRRDRAVLGTLLRRAPAHRLGGGGRRVVRVASRRKGAVVAVGHHRRRGADAAGRIALERRRLVPLLQDHHDQHHHDRRRPWLPRVVGLGQQHPLPDLVPDLHVAQDRALLLLSLPARDAQLALQRARDRSGHRQ